MPLSDVRRVTNQLTNYVSEQEQSVPTDEDIERREDEFERKLLAEGFISHIPTRKETDEEFDAFKPIQFEGEPLSEMIIRERR